MAEATASRFEGHPPRIAAGSHEPEETSDHAGGIGRATPPRASRLNASPPTRRVVETLQILAIGPQSHTEIAQQARMSAATTNAVLTELVSCGWAHRDPRTRLYRLGDELMLWAKHLVRPRVRIQAATQSLAERTGLVTIFGQVRHVPGADSSLVVENYPARMSGPRHRPVDVIEVPFSAPFGSVIAAHSLTSAKEAWLPDDTELRAHFTSKLAQVVKDGYAIEHYGPSAVQLLSLLGRSAFELEADGIAALSRDLHNLIARSDLSQTGQYPAFVSVAVQMPEGPPSSLTVQLDGITDDPHQVLPILRETAAELERVLA